MGYFDDDELPRSHISTGSLCSRCRRGSVIFGEAKSQGKTFCNEIGEWIYFKVTECSDFFDRSDKTVEEFKSAAWILETGKGRTIGFVSPEARRKRERE